jgi:cellulose synthase (UDP-forming)
VVLCATAFLLFQLISLYLSWPKQMILGVVSVVLGLAANRLSTSRVVTLALMLISLAATLRYAWWRGDLLIDFFSDESNHRFGLDAVFMLLLISAEAYTILIMVLGYMQTAWPLRRAPIPLPNDEALWPHVDVLIPTYNEPLSLVRYTALAANTIDYPPEKLHVYILDDGTRPEFAEFAREAGIGYITRVEHAHAKAGNINHALTTMNSPYVAIFDCDHVPTRSFLQMTLGWMLVDPRLAMLQTPHHFYSPDPFERNLLQHKTIPSEAALFYGIIQDGNDFWNATFFCGSCALIRRSALDEVGGIATETVTEDAHTSLRMQKLGYNTAYINIPQAAGLATETLAAHVGQRIRWARGMIQIFRTDNPLLARGMKFTQRLCYLNAMIHFLYAVPRLIFLLAPLVYMLLGRTIIPGYWVAIVAYAFPHLILSSLTNSRIQGRHRHSFWNEIYEAVLAPYILAPTLLALINPKLGKFNVTDKGNTLSKTKFDSKIATPTKWLLFLNLLGLAMVPYRVFIKDPHHPGTVIMNMVWILFNMVILGVAAAVAHEQKQLRRSVRIEAKIPLRIRLDDGQQIDGMTIDMSVGGASVRLSGNEHFAVGDRFRMSFPEHAGDEEIGAKVVGIRNGELRLAFWAPTIAEQETLTRALYSRADAWISSLESKEVDRPLRSLGRVIRLSFHGIYQICRSYLPEKSIPAKPRAAETAAVLALLCVLGAGTRLLGSNLSQESADSQGTGIAGNNMTPLPADNSSNASQVLSLKDMGLVNAVDMRGPHAYYSIRFLLPYELVPTQATLKLLYRFDPAADPQASLKISLNGNALAILSPSTSGSNHAFTEADLPVPADQLARSNTLTFEFFSGGVLQRAGQGGSRILGRISPATTLQVNGDHLRLQNDLSQLPLPIFDGDLQSTTTVPFVFLSPPNAKTLEAAGIVASWLGLQASTKPVRFSVSVGQIAAGNAIVFSNNRSSLPSSLQIPSGSGPVLALRNNPSDANSSALVLAGDDDDQLLTVARTLSLTRKASGTNPAQGLKLTGGTMQIPELVMPPAREKGDAPRWLPLSGNAPIADCQTQNSLVGDGSSPVPVYFHVPPDLYYGERQNLKLRLNYGYNALQVAPGSALRVVVNGQLVNEAELLPGPGFSARNRLIMIPVAAMRPFGNTILFNFDFVPANHEATQDAASGALRGEVFCSSSLDLNGLALWARMPNLELFANAGFPFTQLADLSETTVVLPTVPSAAEISLYLHLMGHFGQQTGYPALRVDVAAPNSVLSDGRDYLVLGTVANQPAFRSLDSLVPVTLDANGVHVKQARGYFSFLSSFEVAVSRSWSRLLGSPTVQTRPSSANGIPDALVEEVQSPSSPDRSIVLVALRDDSSADSFAGVFLDRSQSGDINGSVSLLQYSKFESYPLDGGTYHAGDISWFATMRIWLTQYFLVLLLAVTALSFLVALWTREWLSRHARKRLTFAGTINVAN